MTTYLDADPVMFQKLAGAQDPFVAYAAETPSTESALALLAALGLRSKSVPRAMNKLRARIADPIDQAEADLLSDALVRLGG